MSIFDKLFKNNQADSHKADTPTKPKSVKPKKKIYYQESVLNKQEFYYDASTTRNKNKIMHASLQIGTGDGNWSRMSTTTANVKNKSQYIVLKTPSKNGKQAKISKHILTGTIRTRLNKAKRPKLDKSDMKKIKSFLSRKIKNNQ